MVYLGSVFVEEAVQRAIELTDAAYARTSERSFVKMYWKHYNLIIENPSVQSQVHVF